MKTAVAASEENAFRHGCKAGRRIVADFDEGDIVRFNARIVHVGECWAWGGGDGDDYGQFSYKGKQVSAHRFAYFLWNGDIPPAGVVSHACDRRNCVNPAHLRVTGQRTNMADAYRKGRIRTLPAGSTHPMSKLDETATELIRIRYARGESQRSLAREFGVLQPAISKVVNFRRHRPALRRTPAPAAQPAATRQEWVGLMLRAATLGLESMSFRDADILQEIGKLEAVLESGARRGEPA